MQNLMQITKHTYANSQYPDSLRELPDAPKQLYVRGALPNMPLVAVVGSRRLTAYGKEATYNVAYELAGAGIGIVSGLAIGIDAIAHEAALDAGGYTLAVMGSGLNEIYPARNRQLAARILADGGAIVSEYEADMPPLKHNFPNRNRIISGLSLGVLVTEADAKSGSLITAKCALDQNREVMAVPGNITSPRSAGPNNLIRSGATAITSASDILTLLRVKPNQALIRPQAGSQQEAIIFKLIEQGITTSQELIARSKLSAAEFANVISLMEITGKVRNLGAGTWARR